MSVDRDEEQATLGQSARSSRLSLSNRADEQIEDLGVSTVGLSNREGVDLRAECVYDGLGGTRAVDTETAIDRWRSWYHDSQSTAIVVENELDERAAFTTPNRNTPEYREMLYARAQSLERSLRERWGRLLHTAMLTLTASTTDEDGNDRPLVDHLLDLLASWESVRRALSRVLDGREWEYLAILEPHKSGHVHIHLGVFVKGPVVAEQFQPVLDAHLRNCPTAGREAHRIFDEDGDEDTVRVRRASHPSREDGVENLGAYLAAYMAGEYGAEPTEMPAYVQAFYAALWATGRQWFRPSNGAQEWMQPEEDDDENEWLQEQWEMVGVAPDGDVEDVIEVDPAETAGVEYRTTWFDEWDPPD